MGRIGRSFMLVGESYRILMKDKELMVLPLISGATIAVDRYASEGEAGGWVDPSLLTQAFLPKAR